MAKSVIVTSESETGRNLQFHDKKSGKDMNRPEFVKQIEQGSFPDYYVKKMYGIKTPVSKPDKSISDNLG
jgi:hypothetical protein